MPCAARLVLDLVSIEEFGGERPQPVDRGLHAPATVIGAVAEPHGPLQRVVVVVGGFLHALGGNAGEQFVGRADEFFVQEELVRAEEQLARDRVREVAVLLLDQMHVAKVALGAQVGEIVFVATGRLR